VRFGKITKTRKEAHAQRQKKQIYSENEIQKKESAMNINITEMMVGKQWVKS